MNEFEEETKWNKFRKYRENFNTNAEYATSNKRCKNNYSNIELFGNIYEEKDSTVIKESMESINPSEISDYVKPIEKKNINKNSCSTCFSHDPEISESKSKFRLFQDDSKLLEKIIKERDEKNKQYELDKLNELNKIKEMNEQSRMYENMNNIKEGYSSSEMENKLNDAEKKMNSLEPEAIDYAYKKRIFIEGTNIINTEDARVIMINFYYKSKKGINKVIDASQNFRHKLFDKIVELLNKPAEKFVYTAVKQDVPRPSQNKIDNDIQIIKDFIKNVIMFPVAVLMTYNWIYLIMYKNTNACAPGSTDECRPARDEIRVKIDFSFLEKYSLNIPSEEDTKVNASQVIDYFFDMCIKPLYYLDALLLGDNFLPKIFAFPFIPRIIYNIGLFLFLYILLSIPGGNNIFGLLNSVIIIIHFIRTFASYSRSTMKLANGSAILFVLSTLGIFCSRAIIAYYSIQVSILLCTFYLVLHSFLGIIMYSMKGISIFSIFRYIDAFISEDTKYKEKVHYKEMSPIIKLIFDLFSKISNNKYSFIFLLFYVIRSIVSGLKFQTNGVIYWTTLINFFVAILSLIYVVIGMFKKSDSGVIYKYNIDEKNKSIIRIKSSTKNGGNDDGLKEEAEETESKEEKLNQQEESERKEEKLNQQEESERKEEKLNQPQEESEQKEEETELKEIIDKSQPQLPSQSNNSDSGDNISSNNQLQQLPPN
jgi:hypothetical protein